MSVWTWGLSHVRLLIHSSTALAQRLQLVYEVHPGTLQVTQQCHASAVTQRT